MFPRDRFERAGATTDELDKLETEYDASSPAEQESYEQRFDGQAESGLREYLDGLRKTRHFDGNDIPGVEVGEEGEAIPTAPSQQGGTDGGGNPSGGSVNDPQGEQGSENPPAETDAEKAEREANEAKERDAAKAASRGSGSSR